MSSCNKQLICLDLSKAPLHKTWLSLERGGPAFGGFGTQSQVLMGPGSCPPVTHLSFLLEVERGLFDQPSVCKVTGIARVSKAKCSRYQDLLQPGPVCAGLGSAGAGNCLLQEVTESMQRVRGTMGGARNPLSGLFWSYGGRNAGMNKS